MTYCPRLPKTSRASKNPSSVCRQRPWCLAILVVAWGCGGCARSIVRMDNPLPIDVREYARIFDATVVELRDQGFIINRHDYRFGVITTRPLASPTLLEPWRRQNTTVYQGLESTLNSQRRTVTVTLELVGASTSTDLAPATQPAAPETTVSVNASSATPPSADSTAQVRSYQLRVEVLIERQQHPALHATGSPSAKTLVQPLTAVPRELQDRGITGAYWEPLTRDPYMEQQLIAQIVHRAMTIQAASPALPARTDMVNAKGESGDRDLLTR
jgi:hypothetical protein